ncbi:AraC family transcriptional regulator [Sorangium sp. So ce375]|uniref:AraC family transcriptional regulator n=1 Tax=Sorangium sp. So ce375 TaxID=3133306 RepID=UPI003F5B40E8
MSDISVKVFQAIVAGAAAGGVAPAELLAAAGVDPADLADPDMRFPRPVEARLWCEAARLLGDDSFGLHLAERLQVGSLGALGFAVRSSATVGEALTRAARYLRVVARGPSLEIRIDGDTAHLRHEPPPSGPAPSRHAVEFFLGNLVVLARRGADPAFTPRAARFRHAAPARVDEHRRLFGAGLRFGAAHDELEIERAFLSRPQAHAEPLLCEVLDQHLASLAAAVPAEASFLDRARSAIAAELAHGEPTLPAIAARLRMSPRSVQRRLKEEGASLSSVLDRLRADLAVRYLSESRDAISEVAFLLGFSEVSTFHRAFKRWTGVTPAAYRRGAGSPPRRPARAAPRHSPNSAS